jgi:hemerythrin-like metal-binding protein/PAS domain S-box-containing protein
MFELFPWNPMLETGIGIVDTQHRRLVELLNRLARMSVGEAEPAAVDAVLDGLTAYAQEHFSTEEGIWAAALPADLPLLRSHEAEHAGFCTRVLAARAELKSVASDLCLTRELLLFLSGWLAEHILQSDRRLALVVQALGRGASMPEAVAEAQGVLSGGTGLMVQAALDMYRQLSSQTLELLQERQQREATARALVALKTERERQSLAVSLAGMLLVGDADSLPRDLDTLVRRVGEALAADRCVLRLFSADRQQVHCRAEWCGPGVTASQSLLGVMSTGPALEAWSARLREHGEARISDTHELPDWALLLRPLLEVAGGGAVCAVSLRHRGAFLGWLAVHMVGQPRQWSDDEVRWLQLLGSMVGSSLLRQRAEQQARILLDAVPAGVAAASIGGRRLLFCNDAFCALLGAPREDLLGMDVAELHPPGELARIEREFADLAASEAQPLLTMEVCRPDGGRFLAEIRQVTLELDGERVALGVFTDITRRQATEAALKASEQLLEQQVRTRTAELAEANRRLELAGERMRGLLDLGRQLHTLTEPQLLEQGLELSVQLTSSRDGYLHFLSADGHRIELFAWAASTRAACTAQVPGHYAIEQAGIWADAARRRMPVTHNEFSAESGRGGMPEGHIPLQRHLCVPVLDGESVRMLIGVGNKSEPYDEHDCEQLQLIANGLWGLLLRHRAASALAAARDAAEQASRAKSTFLASMSHEIRTPLNAVIGFAQVLGRDPSLGPRQREQVQIIARSGEHLLQLVNDVLDLSKIEAGQLRLLPVPFNPALLLEEVARLHGPRAAERGLRFTVEGLASLPAQVVGDAGKLRQILLNLLGNALKFTVQGGITLRALADPVETGGWRLRVEVIDTGPGIGSEELARLFTPFEQGVAGERLGGGTGLGLSISRRLATLSGGTLELDSTPGQGSRFRLELPLGDGDPESTASLATASPVSAEVAAEPADVVELDPDLRAGMQDAIRAGDMTRLRLLIDRLDGQRPLLAAQLRVLVQCYDYERLETLLR